MADTARAVAGGALRGVVASMAMTGMRQVSTGLGLVDQTPPEAIVKKVTGPLGNVPTPARRAAIELVHWGYGGAAGAAFGALPAAVRRVPGAGPLYGLAIWLGFELGIAPALGLPHARELRPAERLALAADHVLYGAILGTTPAGESGPPAAEEGTAAEVPAAATAAAPPPPEAAPPAPAGEQVEGFCPRERKKVTMLNPEHVKAKNGRAAVRGTCPDCGAKMFRFEGGS